MEDIKPNVEDDVPLNEDVAEPLDETSSANPSVERENEPDKGKDQNSLMDTSEHEASDTEEVEHCDEKDEELMESDVKPEVPEASLGVAEDVKASLDVQDVKTPLDVQDVKTPLDVEDVVEPLLEDAKMEVLKSPMCPEDEALWQEILLDSELTTGDEMDLTKTLHPLAYYLTNPEELLNQLFVTVKGALYSAIMPSYLKDIKEDDIKSIFLSELKLMDPEELRKVIRGGDFIITPDLLPANPRQVILEKPEETVDSALIEQSKVKAVMNNDDDGFKPYPKKQPEEGKESEPIFDTPLEKKPVVTPGTITPKIEPAESPSFFVGTDDDEKRKLEEALAELEAKEAEAEKCEPFDDEDSVDSMESRKQALEAEVVQTVQTLTKRLDELDNDAESLQVEGYKDLLAADAKDASTRLERIEKSLAETQDEIERIRSSTQAQIDAGVRMMNLNPKFVIYIKDIQELVARGRTLNRLLGPMRAEADRALGGLPEVAAKLAPENNSNFSGSGFGTMPKFQPLNSFVPVNSEPSEKKPATGAEAVFDTEQGQEGRERLTWSARWVSSERVQRVLTHSKVFSKMRQKMGGKKASESAQDGSGAIATGASATLESTASPSVITSIEEYRKFFKASEENKPAFKFDTNQLSSLADQVKQVLDSGNKDRGEGIAPPGVPPPGWPPGPPPEGFFPPPRFAQPAGEMQPQPPFVSGVPPPPFPPPARPPFMDIPPPWMPPPGEPPQIPPPGVPPPGTVGPPPPGWGGPMPPPQMFSQPPPMQPGGALPWQQQHLPPPHWQQPPPQGMMDPSQQGARHWPPLRPEDYNQQPYPNFANPPDISQLNLPGSPLSTSSDEDEDSRKKHKKKHKKEKKKRKKEKKEKKRAKKMKEEPEEDIEDEVPSPREIDAAPCEEGEIRDDEDNLWSKIISN